MATEADKYDILERIGQGSFGIIRKVRRKNDGLILCRKEICYTKMSDKERKQLQAELEILRKLNHPNIVRYYEKEHHKESHDLHLYMEYCGNGDLGIMIKDLKTRHVYADEDDVWTILAQLISALYRCHYGEDPPGANDTAIGLAKNAHPLRSKMDDRMILHRDLKPENVFLGDGNAVKLGDFGLSKMIASHDFASTYVGTPFYMSPEICAAEKYTLYSDVWSLGCVIYELCAREPPFNARTHLELIQKIKSGKVSPLPGSYSAELRDVINMCLKTNPHARPTTADLLNLPRIKMVRKAQDAALSLRQHVQAKDFALEELRLVKEQILLLETEKQTAYDDMNKKLHMEWETRAHLEINRRVDLAEKEFERTIEQRVKDEVARRLTMISSSQASSWSSDSYADSSTRSLRGCEDPIARSSTPTNVPLDSSATLSLTAVNEIEEAPDDDDCPTDLTSLSIDQSPLIKKKSQQSLHSAKPVKRTQRTPFTRARTIANAQTEYADSPMDVQMSDPSPIRNLASLSLSPRRTAPIEQSSLRHPTMREANIFDKAGGAANLTPTIHHGDRFGDIDDDDVQSPSKAKSTDPFKPSVLGSRNGPVRPGFMRQKTMPVQLHSRMRSTPNAQSRTDSVPSPGIENRRAVSPSRRPTTKTGTVSPTRRAPAAPLQSSPTALSARRTREDLLKGLQRNKLQGRTLVELSMTETQNQSRRDGVRGAVTGGSYKGESDRYEKSSRLLAPLWNPETDEMPSPFLVKTRRAVISR